MIHAMIDLETLSTNPNATILTVGGVKFDPHTNVEPAQGMYFRVDVDSQTKIGRDVMQDTLDWWGRQDPEIMEEALGDKDRISLEEMVKTLNKWCVGVHTIWTQGPVFDIGILENIYRQYDHHVPWPFWKIKDSRTLFGIMPIDPRKEVKFAAHNALEDCKVQALCVQKTLKKLGLIVR